MMSMSLLIIIGVFVVLPGHVLSDVLGQYDNATLTCVEKFQNEAVNTRACFKSTEVNLTEADLMSKYRDINLECNQMHIMQNCWRNASDSIGTISTKARIMAPFITAAADTFITFICTNKEEIYDVYDEDLRGNRFKNLTNKCKGEMEGISKRYSGPTTIVFLFCETEETGDDPLNPQNLCRVFGELIECMEEDAKELPARVSSLFKRLGDTLKSSAPCVAYFAKDEQNQI